MDKKSAPIGEVKILPKAARQELIYASEVDKHIRERVIERTIRKVMREFPAFFRAEALYDL